MKSTEIPTKECVKFCETQVFPIVFDYWHQHLLLILDPVNFRLYLQLKNIEHIVMGQNYHSVSGPRSLRIQTPRSYLNPL